MTIDDARIRFYLQHHEDIERWAGLRGEAVLAVDHWLEGLEPGVQDLATQLHAVYLGPTADMWTRFEVRGPDWPPCACIALEWVRRRTTLGPKTSPYVGLRLHKAEPLGQQVREMRSLTSDRKYVSSDYYVAYRYCPPDPDPLSDFENYATQLRQALREAWTDLAPLVDAAIVPSSGPPGE